MEPTVENDAPQRERVEAAFGLLIATCPLPDPIGLNNRELALSAMSAALGAEDADLVDRVAEALRFVGQDWVLRGKARPIPPAEGDKSCPRVVVAEVGVNELGSAVPAPDIPPAVDQ